MCANKLIITEKRELTGVCIQQRVWKQPKQQRTINTLMGIKCIAQRSEVIKMNGFCAVERRMRCFGLVRGNVHSWHMPSWWRSAQFSMKVQQLYSTAADSKWCNWLHDKHLLLTISQNLARFFSRQMRREWNCGSIRILWDFHYFWVSAIVFKFKVWTKIVFKSKVLDEEKLKSFIYRGKMFF